MARPRKTMKTHRDILRHILGLQLSANETHAILGISRGKIQDCLKRAQAAHLRLEQIDAMLDDELESLLFPEKELENEKKESYEPDWEKVLAELQRRGVKLRLLYDERYESAGFDQSSKAVQDQLLDLTQKLEKLEKPWWKKFFSASEQ